MEIEEVLAGRNALNFITNGQHAPHCQMTGAILEETLGFLPMTTTTSRAGNLTYTEPFSYLSEKSIRNLKVI